MRMVEAKEYKTCEKKKGKKEKRKRKGTRTKRRII